ncbi:MAG: hypothetical protein WAO20_15005 [Acidobacteriota bacterium]
MQDRYPQEPDSFEDFSNQYIGVLLELYFVQEENRIRSPLSRSRVRYWKNVAGKFEQLFPEAVQRKTRYRARRAESSGLTSVQVALVRYAWSAHLAFDETPEEVLKRWKDYLLSPFREKQDPIVSYEYFRARRNFRERVREIRSAGLWPWD